MEQRFIKFEEAVEKLGVSAEKLNELREAGELRAYRDGSSWKFRTDEIERLVTDGIPESPPPSDIGLAGPDELVAAGPLSDLPELDDLDELKLDEIELDEIELGEIELGDGDGTSSVDLDAVSGEAVAEQGSPSDSILLSEEELGESLEQPPSTIIGKHEYPDADLKLVDDEDDLGGGDDPGSSSDVKLAAGASDVLSSGITGPGVLDEAGAGTGAFDDLDELEIDLEDEASRIHAPEAAQSARDAAGKAQAAKGTSGESDLELIGDLELSTEGSDLGMGFDVPEEGTDPVPEGLAAGGDGGSDLGLGDEEDFVLADSGGSDITLDSADSGINLIDPSDSGMALDDIPLDVGGSAILSSLSLEGLGSDADLSLVGPDEAGGDPSLADLQTEDDFNLTPLSETADDDQDSSSQVIALDSEVADLGSGDAGLLDDQVTFEEGGLGDDVILTDENYTEDPDAGLAMAPYGGSAVRADSEYSVMNLLGLGSAAMLLVLGMVVLVDMVRNIWSWNEPYALNSSLIEAVCGLFGLR